MKQRKEIWTIELSNISIEEGINDRRCQGYYNDLDGAIATAQEIAKDYKDYDDVVEAVVYQGEYMDEFGNVLGEPQDIYCATNKSPRVSSEARVRAGYSNPYVDFYADNPKVDCKPTEYDNVKYKSALITSPFGSDTGADILLVEEALASVILDENGEPVDRSAEMEDWNIFAYCPADWFDLTEQEFVKNVKEHYA